MAGEKSAAERKCMKPTLESTSKMVELTTVAPVSCAATEIMLPLNLHLICTRNSAVSG